jgi:hypothetical protein
LLLEDQDGNYGPKEHELAQQQTWHQIWMPYRKLEAKKKGS